MDEDVRTVNRRRLLRQAGTVAAGLGAAGVASAVVASPASAAAGSPVVAGQTVDAGTASTGITDNDATNPTLTLGNPSGAQLQLVPSATSLTSLTATAPAGSLNATDYGDLEYQPLAGLTSVVYTSFSATQTWPTAPFRALDTRGLGGVNGGTGREQILNPAVLNSSGKLIGGNTLLLNLTSFVKFGWAVLGNVTVQAPEGGGYLTVCPAGIPVPNTSSVNFLPGWPISNGVFVALGANGTATNQTDVLQIYSPNTTHIIFDVTGFTVPSVYNINPIFLPFAVGPAANHPSTKTPGAAAASRAEQARTFRPKW